MQTDQTDSALKDEQFGNFFGGNKKSNIFHFKFYVMKKILVYTMTALILLSCSSKKITTTSSENAYGVPSSIQGSFQAKYPDATNVTWSHYDAIKVPIDWDLTDWNVLSPNDYVVSYDMKGNRYYTYYDQNGNWVGSTYAITDYNNGLPVSVNEIINKNYSAYTIEKAHRIIWKDRTAYDLKLKNGDNRIKLLVDENGTVIKEKNK